MSFTASQVIGVARKTLHDPNGYRWSDGHMYPLINEALEFILKQLKVETKNEFLILQNNIGNYNMSDKVFELRRIEYKNKTLPFYTYDEMDDKYGITWQSKKSSTIEAIVYDLHKRGYFTVYPIYQQGEADTVLSGNTDFGIISDIGAASLPYAITPTYTDDYGAINLNIKDVLHVFYLPLFINVDSNSDTIDLDISFVETIADFVAGKCYLHNTDRQNVSAATILLQSFERKLEVENRGAAESYVDELRKTPYNPIG